MCKDITLSIYVMKGVLRAFFQYCLDVAKHVSWTVKCVCESDSSKSFAPFISALIFWNVNFGVLVFFHLCNAFATRESVVGQQTHCFTLHLVPPFSWNLSYTMLQSAPTYIVLHTLFHRVMRSFLPINHHKNQSVSAIWVTRLKYECVYLLRVYLGRRR